MSCHSSASQHGFTLVELSIVIVIIGLLVGGILVGQDMIHAAEIRHTISQNEKFNMAVNTFRDKYNCLPGDCPNASNFGFDPTSNGNGDGNIGFCNHSAGCRPTVPNLVLVHEYIDFWYQLGAAGLIAESLPKYTATSVPGVDTPTVKIKARNDSLAVKAGWGVVAGINFLGAAPLGGTYPPHSLSLSSVTAIVPMGDSPSFTPMDMYAIDSKIDDGLPFSGKARAFNVTSINFFAGGSYSFGFMGGGVGVGGPNNPVCARSDTTPYQYNVQYTGSDPLGVCGLAIRGTF